MSNQQEPTLPSDSTPPVEQKPSKDTGADWRILLILGLVVLFLAAVYINKKYSSKSKQVQEPPPEGQQAAQPEEPQLSPAEQYAALVERSQNEARSFFFKYLSRTLYMARPPMWVPAEKGEPRTIDKGPMYDVTNCAAGVDPADFFRRQFFGPREPRVAYMDTFQPMGVSDDVKMVFTPAADVKLDVLSDTEVVIGVSVDGAARAYPLKFANYHDVINDTLAEKPIVVVWSGLGGAANALERTLSDGTTLVFGSAGLMYQSAIMMYNKVQDETKESFSLWSPTLRRCLAGPRAGEKLVPIEARIVIWKEWKRLHPETDVWTATDPVLALDYGWNPSVPPGYFESYGIVHPVIGYDVDKTPMLLKAPVTGVTTPDGKVKAYAMHLVALKTEPFEDTIGDVTLKLSFDKEARILNVETSNGKPCLVEQMFWMTWFGAHPDTEVWREEELLAQMHPKDQAAESPETPAETTTTTTLAEP